jgi:hypothetical protein
MAITLRDQSRLVLHRPLEPQQYASAQISEFATENGLTRSMGLTGISLLTG